MAEVSEMGTTFLDTNMISKVERLRKHSVLDVWTHFNLTEIFQYIHFTSFHPLGVKKGFIKEEALRLLRTNSCKKMVKEKKTKPSDHTLLREVVQKILYFENPLWIKIWREERSPLTKTEGKQIYNINHQWHSLRKIVFNRTTTTTERNLWSAPHFIQKTEYFSKIHWDPSYEERFKHMLGSHAGLLTPLNWLYNSVITINLIDTLP